MIMTLINWHSYEYEGGSPVRFILHQMNHNLEGYIKGHGYAGVRLNALNCSDSKISHAARSCDD